MPQPPPKQRLTNLFTSSLTNNHASSINRLTSTLLCRLSPIVDRIEANKSLLIDSAIMWIEVRLMINMNKNNIATGLVLALLMMTAIAPQAAAEEAGREKTYEGFVIGKMFMQSTISGPIIVTDLAIQLSIVDRTDCGGIVAIDWVTATSVGGSVAGDAAFFVLGTLMVGGADYGFDRTLNVDIDAVEAGQGILSLDFDGRAVLSATLETASYVGAGAGIREQLSAC